MDILHLASCILYLARFSSSLIRSHEKGKCSAVNQFQLLVYSGSGMAGDQAPLTVSNSLAFNSLLRYQSDPGMVSDIAFSQVNKISILFTSWDLFKQVAQGLKIAPNSIGLNTPGGLYNIIPYNK